MSKENSAYLCH